MAVLECIYTGISLNHYCHTALNNTYYTLHYALAPTVSPLHSRPFKMSFFSLSDHSDVWIVRFTFMRRRKICGLCRFRRKYLSRPCSHTHLRVCWFLSWRCPQVSMDILLFTQCTKLCIVIKSPFRAFFNRVSTQFSCFRPKGLLCVFFFLSFFSINDSWLITV